MSSRYLHTVRGRPRAVRLELALACAISIAAVAATWNNARAQQPQGTPLPPVPIEPQAQPKQAPAPVAQPKAAPPTAAAAPKQAVPAPKASPKQAASAPKAAMSPVPISEAEPVPAVALPDGVVLNGGPAVKQSTAGPVSGYRALTGVSATKTDTPIERIPQTINVVPGTVIEDQRPRTQEELWRNVSSVVGMPPTSFYGWGYKVRGFEAERIVDGLPVFYDTGAFTSVVNTERVEVLKGPGGLFYQGGLGITGGTINTVSKLPTADRQYVVGTTFGSFGYWSQFFDVNQPLTSNGTVLFRMTGEHLKSNDFVDVIERGHWTLNPTLTFTNKDTTTLTLQGNFSQRKQHEYAGLPAVGTLDQSAFSIRRDLFIGGPDVPKTSSSLNAVTARLDHKFDQTWSMNASIRYGVTKLDEQTQLFLGNAPAFGSAYGIWNVSLPNDVKELSGSANLIAKFRAGDTKNTVLLGADYNRVKDVAEMWGAPAGFTDLASPTPVWPAYFDPTGIGLPFASADNTYINSGITTQLQTTAWDRLHLLAGVRLAHVEIDNKAPLFGTSYRTDETKALPRLGVAFDIAKGITPFVGYSEGLRGVRFFGGAGNPKPEESQQLEGGVKLVLPFGFTSTIAAFDITKRNVTTADPANPFNSIQTGEQKSQGFEIDATWQPIPGLSVIASYAHINATVTKDNTIPVGNVIDRVPTDSGRLWAHYRVLDGSWAGVSIGAGVHAMSKQAIGINNAYFVPSVVTFDAKLGYDIGNWSFALVGKNLTDKQYFTAYPFLDGRVAPGEPRTVYGTISYKY